MHVQYIHTEYTYVLSFYFFLRTGIFLFLMFRPIANWCPFQSKDEK